MFERWARFQALEAEGSKGIRVEKVFANRSGKQISVRVKVVEEKKAE